MTYKVTVTEDVTSVSVSGNTTSINLTGEQTEISVVNPATSVTFNPSQSFSSTNVQDALFEAHEMIGEQTNNYSVTLDYVNKFEIQDSSNYARFDVDASVSGWFANLKSSDKIAFFTDGNLNAVLDNSGSNFYDKLEVEGSGSTVNGIIQTNNTSGDTRHHFQMKNSGSTKGFLGTTSTQVLLGSGSTSVALNSGGFFGGDFSPASNLGFTKNDSIDLGKDGSRFRDLYLSGGIYFGSDTSNKFDYEKGTWTPTLIGSSGGSYPINSFNSSYTKIGNMVHVQADLNGIDTTGVKHSGRLQIAGLPFQPNEIFTANLANIDFFETNVVDVVLGVTNSSNNVIELRLRHSLFGVIDLMIYSIANGDITVCCTYFTDS